MEKEKAYNLKETKYILMMIFKERVMRPYSLSENLRERSIILLPVHGSVNREGRLVMGAGFLKRVKERFEGKRDVDAVIGEKLLKGVSKPFIMGATDRKTGRRVFLLPFLVAEPFLENPPLERVKESYRNKVEEKFRGKVPGWALKPNLELAEKNLVKAVNGLRSSRYRGDVFAYMPDESLYPLYEKYLSPLSSEREVVIFDDYREVKRFRPSLFADTPLDAVRIALERVFQRPVGMTKGVIPVSVNPWGKYDYDLLPLDTITEVYKLTALVVEKEGKYRTYLNCDEFGKEVPLWMSYRDGVPVAVYYLSCDVDEEVSAVYNFKEISEREKFREKLVLLKEGYSAYREVTGRDDYYSYRSVLERGDEELRVSGIFRARAIKETVEELLGKKVESGLAVSEVHLISDLKMFGPVSREREGMLVTGAIEKGRVVLFVPKPVEVKSPEALFSVVVGRERAFITVRVVPERLRDKMGEKITFLLKSYAETKDWNRSMKKALGEDRGTEPKTKGQLISLFG